MCVSDCVILMFLKFVLSLTKEKVNKKKKVKRVASDTSDSFSDSDGETISSTD